MIVYKPEPDQGAGVRSQNLEPIPVVMARGNDELGTQ
jgi:hypothetical protein